MIQSLPRQCDEQSHRLNVSYAVHRGEIKERLIWRSSETTKRHEIYKKIVDKTKPADKTA